MCAGGAALIELMQLDYIKGAQWDALRVDSVWSVHVRTD